MNVATTISFVFTVAMTLAISVGCKRQGGSESTLGSLDNSVNQNELALNLNYCTRNQNPRVYGEDNPNTAREKKELVTSFMEDPSNFILKPGEEDILGEVSKDIEDVLISVPVFILKPFVQFHKISLARTTPVRCEKISSAVNAKTSGNGELGVEKPFSCWFSEEGVSGLEFGAGAVKTSDSTSAPISTSKAIRHGLLRSMLFLYVLHIAKIEKDSSAAEQELLTALETKKNDLLSRIIVDLKNLGQNESAKKLEQSPDKEALKTSLFIESMDSYYCSKETHDLFAARFQSAYQLFSAK